MECNEHEHEQKKGENEKAENKLLTPPPGDFGPSKIDVKLATATDVSS